MIKHLKAILDFLVAYKDAIAGFIAIGGFLLAVRRSVVRKYHAYLDSRNLQGRIGAELYTKAEILRAMEYYVEPDCQSLDPSGGEDFRKTYAIRQNAFRALDQLVGATTQFRYTILLADSGMGKTTLLLNYYARNYRKNHKALNIFLVPLGYKNADDLIKKAPDRMKTVLFLDAFDEDTRAIDNYRERLKELLGITEGFAHVLISCRTQFFERDMEIPRETGIVRFGVTGPGETREYCFYKLYLSPFSDHQIEMYLRRRFSLFQWRKRRMAREIAHKMPDLTVRPMLLTNIQDLLGPAFNYRYSVQIYEAMIEAWLQREKPFVDPNQLRLFSEQLAVDIYARRLERGSERIPPSEALSLAAHMAIPLQGWQLRSRSLLNRDELGNLKFAHRTIMEYLFVRSFVAQPMRTPKTQWTDQMKRFWWELAGLAADQARGLPAHNGPPQLAYISRMPGVELGSSKIWETLQNADLDGLELLRIRPLGKFTSRSPVRTDEDALEIIKLYCAFNQTYKRFGRRYTPFARLIVPFPADDSEDSPKFVVDFASGLMWAANWSIRATFSGAEEQVRRLGARKWGGYADWRLPTLSEACSLFPDSLTFGFNASSGSYPHDLFSTWNNELWTSESSEFGRGLLVRYLLEQPFEFSATRQGWVQAVRSTS
jgi:hypothetical protein